jgi:hypothetical protein
LADRHGYISFGGQYPRKVRTRSTPPTGEISFNTHGGMDDGVIGAGEPLTWLCLAARKPSTPHRISNCAFSPSMGGELIFTIPVLTDSFNRWKFRNPSMLRQNASIHVVEPNPYTFSQIKTLSCHALFFLCNNRTDPIA